jgi:hypothetical protein
MKEFAHACPTLLHELQIASQRARQGASAPILRTAGLYDLLGLPDDPPWGIDRVSVGEEFYQPEPYPDGLPALIVPAIEDGSLIDLVAVSLATGAVRTRYGEVDYIGHNALFERSCDGEPVPVFADAPSWLRAGGDGIFIVDWTHIRSHLGALPGLVCQTPALARRIRAVFEQALPPIHVASQ